MAAIVDAAPAAEPAATDDGRANRERWHWQETDLGEWVDEWLELNLKNHAFVDTPDLTLRVYSVRRTDGEALLHQRKGRTFCTFNVSLKIGWYAMRRLDGRVVSESRGRVLVPELASADDAELPSKEGEEAAGPGGYAPMARLEATVDGDWEQCAPDMPLSQHKPRDPEPFEAEIKRAVLAALGLPGAADKAAAPPAFAELPPLRARLEALRKDLADLPARKDADAAAKAGAKPPPPPRRGAATREDPGEADPAEEEGAADAARRAAADASAKEYVAALKKKHRNARIDAAIGADAPAGAKEWALRRVGLEDQDLPELVDAVKTRDGGAFAAKLEVLDLSGNEKLSDSGLQPLLLALACGAAPKLARLSLADNDALGEIVKRQVAGLKLMRKGLEVQL